MLLLKQMHYNLLDLLFVALQICQFDFFIFILRSIEILG